MKLKLKKQKAMETKKSLRVNLEKGKTISFMMGMVVALAVLFTGFEWGENDLRIDLSGKINLPPDGGEPIVLSVPEPPEPPKPEISVSPEVIVLVGDNEKVEDIEFKPSEFDKNERQPVYVSTIVEKPDVLDPMDIFIGVEIMPEFPGGENAMLKWIAEHISYPTIAAENGIEGRVACSFVVNADGSVSDIEVLRSKDPLLDKEAVRVLKLMPRWKPGMQQGKNVRVKFSVPVLFRLQK